MHRIIVEAGPKKTKVRRGAERKSEIFRREKELRIIFHRVRSTLGYLRYPDEHKLSF